LKLCHLADPLKLDRGPLPDREEDIGEIAPEFKAIATGNRALRLKPA
jgi:hypothetical protein